MGGGAVSKGGGEKGTRKQKVISHLAGKPEGCFPQAGGSADPQAFEPS